MLTPLRLGCYPSSVLSVFAAALCLWLSGCTGNPGKPSAQPSNAAQSDDPSILVVVHSWTGRTAVAGRTLAESAGAKMLLASDPKSESGAPTMDELISSLSEGKVRRLYLGFPIWDEAPSLPAQRFVATAPLAGVTVVPFYTYLHYVDPPTLEQLAETIRARGGTPIAPLALHIPLSFTDAQIACATRRGLLDRPETWPWSPESARAHQCAPAPPDGVLCHVPAGWVWLGDTSDDCVGPLPRAVHVDAFSIGQTEVGIAEYNLCVEAQACPPAQTSSGISKELIASGDTSLPTPGVSYAAARAYCAWRGMRLPTEAEWIRAGRGDGTAPYPWGAKLDAEPLRGNFGDHAGQGYPHYSPAAPDWPADGVRGLARGCRFPAGTSPFGVCDLAGNLGEWVARVDDPDGQQPVQILKGGSWLDAEPTALRLSAQAHMPVAVGGFYLSGFRCARVERRATDNPQ